MSGSQRYRAAHKGTGRQTNDTGRRTKGIEGNRNELNAVHIQLCLSRQLFTARPTSSLDLIKVKLMYPCFTSVERGTVSLGYNMEADKV